tara:strand:+ start:177 stop:989 length:813 start_codon:yes stop_codon:yes gene_type:complete
MSATMEFYNDINTGLKRFVKHIWYSSGILQESDVNPKLIPMDHLDLILRKEGDIKLIVNDEKISPSQWLFQGMNTNIVEVEQKGFYSIFGIGFTPWGLYPFVNQSIDTLIDSAFGYGRGSISFIDDLLESIKEGDNIQDTYVKIEEILNKHLNISYTYLQAIPVIENFINTYDMDISHFCDNNHIHKRKLERDFKKYVGISPREYKRIKQLVKSTRHLISKETRPLIEIGQESSFYDQAHFSRNFKKYMDYTPKEFRDKDPALKTKIDFI